MSNPVQILFTGLVGMAGLALAAPTQATTVADFTPVAAGANLRFVNNGVGVPEQTGSGGQLYSTASPSGQSPGLAPVSFRFQSGPLAGLGVLPAWLMLNATTVTPASIDNGVLTQGGLSGSLRFVSRTPLTQGTTSYAPGIDLLSAVFTDAALVGAVDTGTARFTTAGGSVSFGSDLFTFDNARDLGLDFNLASLLPAFTVSGGGRAVQSFRSEVSGSASASNGVPISAVPEPESWALLITGFALIGVQQRRRLRAAPR